MAFASAEMVRNDNASNVLPDLSATNKGAGIFGTTSVQFRARKNGFLFPKRHQAKHLEFLFLWFGTRGSEVRILSSRILFT
jgi:hypothetical protein